MEKPLIKAMTEYLQDDVYPLHTPGHKGGRCLDDDFAKLLHAGAKIDVSLMDELDDLHNPKGVIAQAQKLAAKLYGSEACFWCVNGTTQAIQTMVISTVKKGDKVLVARNSHISVFNALILAGAEPVYVLPEYNTDFSIYTQITASSVRDALMLDNSIKAVLITSPNYYGIVADVAAIAKVCHEFNVPLLVDEAHGAHLGFHDSLPKSSLRCGADLVAQSTHKLLGALTQCSMLHVKSKLIDIQKVRDVIGILTTTSPNYLLMASLDAARAQMAENGSMYCERALNMANRLRNTFRAAGLNVLEEKNVNNFALDKTKVFVNLDSVEVSGVELAALLRKEGIAVELADGRNILCLVTFSDENADFYAMLVRLRKVLTNLKQAKTKKIGVQDIPKTEKVKTLAEVFQGKKKVVELAQSEGEIAAESISFYPPGIPVLLPGEKITKDTIEYIVFQKNLGLVIKGPMDDSLNTIRVVAE